VLLNKGRITDGNEVVAAGRQQGGSNVAATPAALGSRKSKRQQQQQHQPVTNAHVDMPWAKRQRNSAARKKKPDAAVVHEAAWLIVD
jgi:hypothetical protein